MLTDLHDAFAELLQQGRRWSPPLAPNDWPVFFVDGYSLHDNDDNAADAAYQAIFVHHTSHDDAPRLAFPQMWIVGTPLEVTEGITALQVVDRPQGNLPWSATMFSRPHGGSWDCMSDAGQEFAGALVWHALRRINRHQRVETDSPARDRINAGRQRSNSPLPLVPPFITLGGLISDRSAASTGAGAPKAAHDRRGHLRTYKATGKQIWVKDCAIHGGASEPRNYKV